MYPANQFDILTETLSIEPAPRTFVFRTLLRLLSGRAGFGSLVSG